MTKLGKLFIVLSIYIASFSTHAYEFKILQLKGELAGRALLKNNLRSAQNKLANINEQSDLLNEIEGILTGEYENIGKDQTKKLLENYKLGGGVVNFSGFTWHKPMLNYDIDVNRELAPDLMSNKWIVHDSLTLKIEASTLIANLIKDKSLEKISEAELGAFAGLSFKRTYHYNHFANSYEEGLTSNFSKLFLSFKYFRANDSFKLTPYDILKKVDEFKYNAGGLIKAPLGSNLALKTGVLVKSAFITSTILQSLGPEDNDNEHRLRLSVEKERLKSKQVEIDLELEFFNLLKISLLQYDLEYQYGEGQKTYLSFSQNDIELIKSNNEYLKEYENLLKGKMQIRLLLPNIVSHEKRIHENLNSKFSFLIFGEMKNRATEQVELIKDGISKIFFKNYSESIEYVENLFSKIFQSFIFKIFHFKNSTEKRMQTTKKVAIEYEKIKNFPPTSVKEEEEFSLRFTHKLEIKKTHKWYHHNYKMTAKRHLKNMTSLSHEFQKKLHNEELRGPLAISTTVEIGKDALIYFNAKKTDQLINTFLKLCEVPKNNWRNYFTAKKRKRFLRGRLSNDEKCLRSIVSRFNDFKNHSIPHEIIDLFRFKKFIGSFLTKVKEISDLEEIFGKDNLFVHGEFQAKTSQGKNFQTFFKSGQFRGLGVIENYKNSQTMKNRIQQIQSE